MALFMEYTTVDDTTTVAAIQHLLATRGASSVQVEYDAGKVVGVKFLLLVDSAKIPFCLPCRWQAIEKLLKSRGKKVKKHDTIEMMARRIAWRQILRWVEAQLALIETGMVKTQEVFLPYVMVGSNGQQQTMFQMIEAAKYYALPAPEKDDKDE